VQPHLLRDEELGRGAADAEPEVVAADDAFADDPIAGSQTLDGGRT
jgi:hypothetical protein